MKRDASDLQQLQNSAKSSNKLIIRGIEKFFDPKQCYKYLRKHCEVHVHDHSEPISTSEPAGDAQPVDKPVNKTQSTGKLESKEIASVLKTQEKGSQSDGKIYVTHICKPRNKPFFIVRFAEEVNVDRFNEKCCGKKKHVKAKILPDNFEEQNDIGEEDYMQISDVQKPAEKKIKQASPQQLKVVMETKIEDIVASLHHMPYQEQVKFKIDELNKIIEKYNIAFFRDEEVKRLIRQLDRDIPPLKLQEFVECHKDREGYRSKSEFTIGSDPQSKQPVIGFNKGNYYNQTIMVQSPKNVNIISNSTKLVVAVLENYIKMLLQRDNSFPPFDRVLQTGFWRYLIVRESHRTKQSMIIVVCKTQGFDPIKVKQVKEEISEYLKTAVIGLKSLCFLSYNGEADCVPTEKPELLFGEPFYQQIIFDHTFRVSPSAFLQINIEMCEALYQRIIDAVKMQSYEVVLDLGCGIGTIGISIMKQLHNIKVVGVEICEEAVKDALINEPTYEVHLGRVEDKIKDICEAHKGKNIVAILDPPRAGFNKQVMLALRRCKGLDNVIYVACNAAAIQDNLLQLTLPVTQRRKAPEFRIDWMVGLDLFPQTPHFEALYILQRKY